MRRLLLFVFVTLMFYPAGEARAQPTIPEAPVRYDTDLLPASFHQSRRTAVLSTLPDNAVAVVFNAPERNRENDVSFEYRPSSDFYYLTGAHEAGSVLLLAPGGIEVDGATVKELLLVPARNPNSEVWTGRLFGPERAKAELGIEEVVSNERYEEILGALAKRPDVQFYHLPLPSGVDESSTLARQIAVFKASAKPFLFEDDPSASRTFQFILGLNDGSRFGQIKSFMTRQVNADSFTSEPLREAFQAFADAETFEDWQAWRKANIDAQYANGSKLRTVLNELRMVKTDAEIALMQRAIDITAAAQREAMKSMEPGMYEYELEALIEYVFKRNGAEYTGFPSIVGSGENATILHYESNRRRMQAEDMVVMDIGAEYHGYSADITRTAPVNGVFSPEQKTIYELVLAAQEAGIKAARKGNSFSAPHQAAWTVVANGLRELGLIEDDADVRNFFMHGTSHYLGLYVHDVGNGGPLVPGTVITVEPGIYISPSPEVDPKWWNIGVRIEDDVLVTDSDPVVMSKWAPRTVAEIEVLMKERGLGNETNGLVSRSASGDTQGSR